MIIREYNEQDLHKIDRIWREHHSHLYSLPHRRNRLFEAIVEGSNHEILGYGQVKAFAEAMIFLDLSLSSYQRARVFKMMMDKAIGEVKRLGISDMYAFAKDPDFALVLEKKYKFNRVDDPGELLLREL
jgi:hypothetical protein